MHREALASLSGSRPTEPASLTFKSLDLAECKLLLSGPCCWILSLVGKCPCDTCRYICGLWEWRDVRRDGDMKGRRRCSLWQAGHSRMSLWLLQTLWTCHFLYVLYPLLKALKILSEGCFWLLKSLITWINLHYPLVNMSILDRYIILPL